MAVPRRTRWGAGRRKPIVIDRLSAGSQYKVMLIAQEGQILHRDGSPVITANRENQDRADQRTAVFGAAQLRRGAPHRRRHRGGGEEAEPVTEQRVWLATVYPIGIGDIFGSAWDSDRLHRSRRSAEQEAQEIMSKLGLSPVEWNEINEHWAIGRCHKLGNPNETYGVTVRGVLLPVDSDPASTENHKGSGQ